ncbi:helix-turn-helix domain-containing protein [Streptomyces sp. NPDC058653]|uniref:helix-turn-helix domain-containing protein n=1 Tax=Streptomyces sp. NPDC058653 TaxID=3346576 RepID=UPI00364A41AA
MARWRPLSTELRPEVRRLVERLRLLKDRSGLSYASLEAKTSYSTSSWSRYLGGVAFPPWEATEALGRLAGAKEPDLARLRALWESAEEVRGKRGAGAALVMADSVPSSSAAPASAPRTPLRLGSGAAHAVRTAVSVLVLVLLASVPYSSPYVPRKADEPEWPWSLPSEVAPVGEQVECQGRSCERRDPVQTGCSGDGRVLGSYYRKQHRVQVLHSARCRTVWGSVAPAADTEGLSISAPGAAQLQEKPGARRTRMLAVLDSAGVGAQACVVVSGEHSCVNSDNRAWTD